MEIRKIRLSDKAAFRIFEKAMLNDKETNPFVEWSEIIDFDQYVADSDRSEMKKEEQTWSSFTRYFAFVNGEIAGLVICFWEIDHPICQQLGHLGYMVAPKFRRQGLATALTHYGLERYREKGVSSVYICMEPENIASRKTAEASGGRFLEMIEIEGHGQTRRAAKYEVLL